MFLRHAMWQVNSMVVHMLIPFTPIEISNALKNPMKMVMIINTFVFE
jgi:hypothetical protein